MTDREQATREALAHATGTEGYTAHALSRKLLTTSGVEAMAEAAEAYWLTDIIASLYWEKNILSSLEEEGNGNPPNLLVVKLKQMKDSSAVLTVRGMDKEEDIYRQEIPYSTFPLPEGITMWWNMYSHADEGYHVLYLPTEH